MKRAVGGVVSAGLALGLAGSQAPAPQPEASKYGCYPVQTGPFQLPQGETPASSEARQLAWSLLDAVNQRCQTPQEGDVINRLNTENAVTIRITRLGAGLVSLAGSGVEAPERQAAAISVRRTEDGQLDRTGITDIHLYTGTHDPASGASYEVNITRDPEQNFCDWQIAINQRDGGFGGSMIATNTQRPDN